MYRNRVRVVVRRGVRRAGTGEMLRKGRVLVRVGCLYPFSRLGVAAAAAVGMRVSIMLRG